jgi:hypothetical protein
MASKGFIDSVDTRISQIRVNLTDLYYLGFPVVKELLANADDAGATCLNLGWARAPSGTTHPLLDRPGIFLVNDGPFRTLDEEGVRRLGLGSRGGDIATIGRFGLGLKSTFHLCDAFFYLASGRDGDSSNPIADVLNPWSHEVRGKHAEWDSFEPSDAVALRRILSPCCQTAHWFAIWLPLRSQRDAKPHIMQEYPGDRDGPPDQVLGLSVIHRIAKIIPLLSNLRSVRLWRGDTSDVSPRLIGATQLASASQRRRTSDQLRTAAGPASLDGSVDVIIEQSVADRVVFSGVENQLNEELVAVVRSHPKWPHRPVLDPATNDWVDRPDKATPHVAVQFMRRPASDNNATLRLSWASYLPVGEPDQTDCVPVDGNHDWEVVLHGAFFVDAGRRLVDFTITKELEDERSVRVAWNSVLRKSGVLPLVIGALQRVTQGPEALNMDSVAALTRAIGSTKSLGEHEARQYICSEHQWVCLVGERGSTWQTLPTSDRILSLPISASVEWSLEAMPSLQLVSQRFHLTPATSPRLVAREPECVWPSEATSVLLMEIDDLGDIPFDHVRYRIDTICRITGERMHPTLSAALLGFVKALLLARKLSEAVEHRTILGKLLRLLPDSAVISIPLPCKSIRSHEILRTINRASEASDVIFIPEELLDEAFVQRQTGSTFPLSSVMVSSALVALDACEPRLKGVPHFSRLAAYLLLRCRNRDHVVQECSDLRLFRDERSDSTVIWSIAELRALHSSSRLTSRNDNTDLKWQRAVGSAVASEFSLVHDDVGRALFDPPPPSCDAAWGVQLLCSYPDLTAPTHRRELLELLLSKCDLDQLINRRAIRYLLHGTREPSSEDAVLLEPGSATEATVWHRLAKSAMHASGERWRLIDTTLVEPLSNAHRKALSIDSIDPRGVEHLLGQIDLSIIAWRSLTTSDRLQLMVFIEDGNLLARLPIHETSDGRFISINDQTFLDSSWARSASALASRVAILRSPADQRAAARQAQLAEEFDARAVLILGLGTEAPSRYWPSIVAAASEWLATSPTDSALRGQLATTPWLPTTNGNVVSPQDVVKLPNDAATVGLALLPPGSHSLCPREALHEDLLGAAAFRACEEHLILPPGEQFTRLAGLLATVPTCRIGRVDISDTDGLDDWLQAFESGSAERAMPVSRLIARFKSQELRRLCIDELLPSIALDMPAERLIQVLLHLAEAHRTASIDLRDRVWPVFLKYLALVAHLSEAMSVLSAIRLPAKDGRWRRATELCVDAHGVADGCLLRHDCCQALAHVLASTRTQEEPPDGSTAQSNDAPVLEDLLAAITASAITLESFVAPWARVADEELIGATLGLFGDDAGIARVRSRFLDATKLTVFRNSLEWQTFEFSQMGGARETLDDMMRKQRFVVSVFDATLIRVTSLVGTPFDAPLSDTVRTLLIGDRAPRFISTARKDGIGVRVNELRLRRVDPAALGRETCNEILRETARALLSDLYWRTVPNFDEKWNSLAQADQVDLEFTRTWLLHQAPIYLEQLGLRTHERLGPLLRELKDADRHEHLERHEGVPPARRKGASRRSAAAAELYRMLSEDGEVAEAMLAAVRRKVGDDAQYEADSVPFELFQNADDAVTELAMYHEPSRPLCAQERHWAVAVIPDGLAFVHRGRCVNQFRLGAADCSSRGFSQDLEKMLVLQASDKQLTQDAAPVTGKFGLGFKSTFLVSDHPLIWSGRLRCKIHGALLPLNDEEPRSAIDTFLVAHDDANRATAVVLPLRNSIATDAVLAKIARLFPIQVIFARSIRSCELNDGRRQLSFSWHAEPLSKCSRVTTGALPLVPSVLPAGARVMSFQAGIDEADSAALLMLLDRRGFVAIPEEVPSVWVTTPTKERLDLGAVINAPFAVDVGRAQLARESTANNLLAESIATRLALSLSQLADACESDWPSLRADLAIDPGVDLGEFWASLWEVISQLARRLRHASDTPGAGRLLSIALWGSSGGAFSHLVSVRRVVPTGLPGPLAGLVRAGDVRSIVHAWLAEHPSVLVEALLLPSSAARLAVGSAVSANVWDTLSTSLSPRSRPNEVSLATFIGWEIEHDRHFDASRAERFAFLSEKDVKEHLESLLTQDLRELIGRAEFLAKSGEYEPAVDLLIADTALDESLRASFAPANRVLAVGYAAEAMPFFNLCRGQLQAPARLLAEWASAARTEPQRKGVVQYLLRGELRNEVCQALVQQYAECWVFSLGRTSPEVAHLPPHQAIEFLAKVGVIRGWDDLGLHSPVGPEPVNTVRLDPTRCLRAIAAWWTQEHQSRLIEYSRRTYPHHITMEGLAVWKPGDREHRRAWLTLLLLGAFHTMGRAQPGQHRSFLEHCHQQGWLDRFANEPTAASTWVDCLEHYFGQQVQDSPFLHWMLQLPRIYVLSRWLPDYAEAFLSIDRAGPAAQPFDILATRASTRFQGGGVDAPPLGRVLGFGYCFVLRELCRHRALERDDIGHDCFVPTKRLRVLLASLGCQIDVEAGSVHQSREVHAFLSQHLGIENAHFGGAFDIPLQIVAEDLALQSELFGKTLPEGEGGTDDSEW